MESASLILKPESRIRQTSTWTRFSVNAVARVRYQSCNLLLRESGKYVLLFIQTRNTDKRRRVSFFMKPTAKGVDALQIGVDADGSEAAGT